MKTSLLFVAIISGCSSAEVRPDPDAVPDGGRPQAPPEAAPRAEDAGQPPQDAGPAPGPAEAGPGPPGGPTSSLVRCTLRGPSGVMYAEKAYPGRTIAELARVVVLVQTTPLDLQGSTAGTYSMAHAATWVRDGYVAANCGGSVALFVDPP